MPRVFELKKRAIDVDQQISNISLEVSDEKFIHVSESGATKDRQFFQVW